MRLKLSKVLSWVGLNITNEKAGFSSSSKLKEKRLKKKQKSYLVNGNDVQHNKKTRSRVKLHLKSFEGTDSF